MPNRRPSIKAALRTNRELGKLFAKLGTAEHPRGKVLVAYRNARRALRDVLRQRTPAIAMGAWLGAYHETQEVMAGLKDSVRTVVNTTLDSAWALGWKQAIIEGRVWNIEPQLQHIDTMPMLDAIIGIVEQQERGILATLATGADPALILGSDTTVGLLRPDIVTREGARWLATAAGLALIGALQPAMQASGRAWGKQAIAAIDAVTTECCLRVHGQVVPEKRQFHTTGTPAWADYQDWTPFHWNCRTSVGMVPMDETDDDLTAMLLEQSAGEQKKRRDARLRIAEIREALVGKKAIPDARRRADDTKAITELREELLALRQRGGYAQGG
jgi:hypothetical protein